MDEVLWRSLVRPMQTSPGEAVQHLTISFQIGLARMRLQAARSGGKAGFGARPEVAQHCEANRTPNDIRFCLFERSKQSLDVLTECDPPCNPILRDNFICGTSPSFAEPRTPFPVPVLVPRTLRGAAFSSCEAHLQREAEAKYHPYHWHRRLRGRAPAP